MYVNGPTDSVLKGTNQHGRLLGDCRVFESRDLDQTRDHIARTYCPHRLSIASSNDALDAWLNHKTLSQIGLGTMSYGTEVFISGVEDQDFILLMLPLSGSADIGFGKQSLDSNSRRASVVNTVELDRMRWSRDCAQLVVQISTAAIDRHVELMTGRSVGDPIRFSPEMELRDDRTSWWNYVSLMLGELAVPTGQSAAASISQLETLLIVKLLEAQPSNYSERLRPQICKIAPTHVRRVERFINDNISRPIALEEMIEISGVSARALFDGFRRFRGFSPMAYLRSVRLERVRENLQHAQPGETVTTIASQWGFFQFGRFAGLYRQVYGELPSETLRSKS